MLGVIMEQLADGTINYKRCPGVNFFTQSAGGSIHCRGFALANQNTLIAIYNGFAEAITISGAGLPVSAPLGELDGTKIVTTAVNNNSPTPDIACVTEFGAFVLKTSSGPLSYPDSNIGSPNSVCFGDGYFFFTYGKGTCLASNINSTVLNPLNVATVNSASDGLLRGVFYAQTLFLFTPSRIEAWVNTANPTGFPFTRSSVIPRGLISATAVAGHESSFVSTLCWVGNDNIVYSMQGYSPVRISTHDIERRIQAVADKTTLRACVYMSEGHAFWQLSSANFTFAYDIMNQVWAERPGNPFSRIENAVFAFGRWLVGDFSTGSIGKIDPNYFYEYSAPLIWELTSLPTEAFPRKMIISRMDADFISGTGKVNGIKPIESDPTIDISWSDDGGASFKAPVQRPLGEIGMSGVTVQVLRSGQSKRFGRVWKYHVSDPVYVGLLGATMEAL